MTGLKATLCVVLVFLSLAVSAQTSSSDPQAIATRLSVLQAVTAGIAVTDLSLQGSVIKIAGSDNLNGTAVLETRGITQSRYETPQADRGPTRQGLFDRLQVRTWRSMRDGSIPRFLCLSRSQIRQWCSRMWDRKPEMASLFSTFMYTGCPVLPAKGPLHFFNT
jgi:hypothetical protein